MSIYFIFEVFRVYFAIDMFCFFCSININVRRKKNVEMIIKTFSNVC